MPNETKEVTDEAVTAPEQTLTVTDNRTGRTYELPIVDDTIRAMDLRQIKVHEDDFGMMAFDPAFTNTAACRSSITYIDGEAGILEHRGIPIEQLCEHSTFLEVAYLLVYGELPTRRQLEDWKNIFDHGFNAGGPKHACLLGSGAGGQAWQPPRTCVVAQPTALQLPALPFNSFRKPPLSLPTTCAQT